MSESRGPDHTLGVHLYTLREACGLTLRQAGGAAGIAFSRLAELERGIDSHTGLPVRPTYEQLVRLARAYKTPVEQLLRRGGFFAGLDLPEDEQRLLAAYRALPLPLQPAALMALEAQARHFKQPG
jgi:transcriptional regulator with XRE-family HTH domain